MGESVNARVRGSQSRVAKSEEGGVQAWMSLRRRSGGGGPEAGPDGSRRARLDWLVWLGRFGVARGRKAGLV